MTDMLQCPKCGWEKREDVIPGDRGLRCVNCTRYVKPQDIELVNYVKKKEPEDPGG